MALPTDWIETQGYKAANQVAKENFASIVLREGAAWPNTGTYHNITNLATTYDAAALRAVGTLTVGGGIYAIGANYLLPSAERAEALTMLTEVS